MLLPAAERFSVLKMSRYKKLMKALLFYLTLSLIAFVIGVSAVTVYRQNNKKNDDLFICPG